jgi:tripartite-type tricarboxylate transporter receptor subunit TctC
MRIIAKAGLLLTAALALAPVQRAAAANFYEGKQLTVLVNLAAGGSTDIEARIWARFLGKHIPGNPTVIVKNMTGAGGLVAANYLGQVAKPDGLTIGYFADTLTRLLVDDPGLEIDLRKLDYIASSPGIAVGYVRTDTKPGIKVAEDFVKAQDLKVGGLQLSSSKDLRMRMMFDMLGLKYRYTTGYKGMADVRRAFAQGEVQYADESPSAYRSAIEPTFVKNGEAIPLWQFPVDDGEKMYIAPEGKEIPALPFHAYYEKVKGKKPEGQMWEAFRALNQVGTSLLRTIVMPPGSPKEALEVLRDATIKVGDDPEFQAEAMKSVKSVSTFVRGDKVERQLANFRVDAKLKTYIAQYIAEGQNR